MKNYTAVLKKSGRQFVALCLELGVVGCGTTRSKAITNLRDAIDSYLDYAAEVGLLESRPVAISELHEFLFSATRYDRRRNRSCVGVSHPRPLDEDE